MTCRVIPRVTMVAVAVIAPISFVGSSSAGAAPPDSTWVWDGGTDTFTEFDGPVDVTVAAWVTDPDLPKSFERSDAIVGDGAELDETDLVANPAELDGAVAVDIDQVAGSITVSAVEQGCWSGLSVTISYGGPTTLITPVADGLFGGAEGVELVAESGDGTYTLTWTTSGEACVELGPAGATSTFDYALLVLVYDDFGPDDPLPIAGSEGRVAIIALVLLVGGLTAAAAATRRRGRTA